MNELLRLANKVAEDVEYIIREDLASAGEPYDAKLNAYKVIQGYQELIRRLIVNLEASDSYVENNRCLSDANDVLLLEAVASIGE